MPADVFAMGRKITAYVVPAVTVNGVVKVAVKNPPAPLLKPGIVAVARSAPVGSAGVPAVARIDRLMFGVVPVQLLQKRSRSTLVMGPEIAALNVWPAQFVALKPKPLFVTFVFC